MMDWETLTQQMAHEGYNWDLYLHHANEGAGGVAWPVGIKSTDASVRTTLTDPVAALTDLRDKCRVAWGQRADRYGAAAFLARPEDRSNG